MKNLSFPVIAIIGIILLALLIFAHSNLYSYLNQFDSLEKNGVLAEAKMIGISPRAIEYEYIVDDSLYRHKDVFGESRQMEVWEHFNIEDLKLDENIKILYDEINPKHSKVFTKQKSNLRLILVLILDVLVLNFVAFFAMRYRKQA